MQNIIGFALNMIISYELKIKFKKRGQQIQILRNIRGICIEKFSKATGIRKEYLEKIEKGNAYGIKIDKHLIKIAKVLNIKLSELFE